MQDMVLVKNPTMTWASTCRRVRGLLFFRRWETTVQGGGDRGLERTMGTNRDEAGTSIQERALEL